jgi:lipoic acid synthetase
MFHNNKPNKPDWIRVKLSVNKKYRQISNLVQKYKLNTICQSGKCPNIGECWKHGVATFMILGNICTRSCKFCSVQTGKPQKLDIYEPYKVAQSIKIMQIKHAVITSVNRDDLKDKGAFAWANTIKIIRNMNPSITLETLIPDFKGCNELKDIIINEKPEVISHNIETVKRLTKQVRVQAKYDTSLYVLKYLKRKNQKIVKTGIMLGLGEFENEVIETMEDLINIGVDVLTIGQYLQPTKNHLPVSAFIEPDIFKKYKELGLKMGFKYVESGPLVRSSYKANKHLL